MLLLAASVTALVASSFILLTTQGAPAMKVYTGSLFVSDAGRSHGGFEYVATWNVTLRVSERSGAGELDLALASGLGDPLTEHSFKATGFTSAPSMLTFELDGEQVRLVWVENDTVWNHTYDSHFIASWGSDAPQGELRGVIAPSTFPGLVSSYYLEIRLR